MAPKGKKGKKQQQDDWEAELGEDATQQINGTVDTEQSQEKQTDEPDADGESGGGGLLAALRKNKDKRKKKGRADNDFVEGEDPTADVEVGGVEDDGLAAKAPEEANFDDEDVFAGNANKKGKGGKKEAQQDDEDQDGEDVAGGMKSKKEKEREKKEREKARKKEQVRRTCSIF